LIPDRPSPRPIDLPMTPLAIGGTLLWAIAAVIMWINMDTLDATGRSWWFDCAIYGAALGVPGTTVMILHDRKRRRDPDAHQD